MRGCDSPYRNRLIASISLTTLDHLTRHRPTSRELLLERGRQRSSLGKIPMLRHGVRSSPAPTMFTVREFRHHEFCD